ncbi:MAG: DUF4252 domain-containing protein [Silvibacterium sp.]|jgi:hypothetical protein
MPRSHRLAGFVFLTLLATAPFLVQAQQSNSAQSYPDDTWIPRGMDALGNHASFHTDFTFDKAMLDMANNFVGDEETHRVVAKLRGISVHSFRYPAPGLYDTRALNTVRSQYHDRGWKHLVTSEGHGLAKPGHSDVWIRFEHGDVEGLVLLVADEKNLNLVAINGEISPVDLLHLRGHFGIPKFSGDDFVDQNN